jgi:hypothetical protein
MLFNPKDNIFLMHCGSYTNKLHWQDPGSVESFQERHVNAFIESHILTITPI